MFGKPILFDKDSLYIQKIKPCATYFLIVSLLCFLSISPVFAKTFLFKYHTGDTTRVLSTTEQDVFFNGQLDHHSTIVNRISEEVLEVNDDGSGLLKTHFMTTEQATVVNKSDPYQWGKEYESEYICNLQGEYNISDSYFMPTVRNVPTFLKTDVQIGDTWTAEGIEAHDLRESLGIETPYKIPFTANYTYEGTIEEEGKLLDIINVKYNIVYKTPKEPTNDKNYPIKNFIYSNATLYWDNEAGALLHYNENFRIMFEMSLGDTIEYEATAHAKITDIQRQATKKNIDDIQNQIDTMNIEDTKAEITDRGIKISLENIKFMANSSALMESEKAKLNKIASILKTLPPENDLLIGGHTAKFGSVQSQISLSEDRANTVAQYLISLQVRDPSAIFTKGYGATEPVAPNDSEANMARNRRVEITILDN